MSLRGFRRARLLLPAWLLWKRDLDVGRFANNGNCLVTLAPGELSVCSCYGP